ncbi:MAG: Mut7-C RNAse domain-containing protein [Candidatus Ozemobacteraceae bacterium]
MSLSLNRQKVSFEIFGSLRDFLPSNRKDRKISSPFFPGQTVKDAIEALGIPHPEVRIIVKNETISVLFSEQIQPGDCYQIYSSENTLSVIPLHFLNSIPDGDKGFILDVHLGKLARKLRMLGFDVLYRNDYSDPKIVEIAAREGRTILTRDIHLLMRGQVVFGYWIRALDPNRQLEEILKRFSLINFLRPFSRCIICNGQILPIPMSQIIDLLPQRVKKIYSEFFRCCVCQKIFWKGSHYEKMQRVLSQILISKPA